MDGVEDHFNYDANPACATVLYYAYCMFQHQSNTPIGLASI